VHFGGEHVLVVLPARLEDTDAMTTGTQNIRALKQWVCWRWEERDGSKPTKVPYSPLTGKRASSTNPDSWAGYPEAVAAYRKHGHAGIGLVLTKEDDLVGVDLDGCLDPESGEMEPWAREIIEELDSYAEISPSATGVHVLVRAKLPEGRNRRGRFEAYDRARYLTMSGKHLSGTPRSIEGRQEQLDRVVGRVFGEESINGHKAPLPDLESGLSDQEVLEKAAAADNAEKFRRLWAGDTSGYTSASEADAALCSLLAFWTGPDEVRIDGLFRRSGLYRKKWERADYRAKTISKALDGKSEFYGPKVQAKLKSGGLLDNAYNAVLRELPRAPVFPVDALPVSCRRFVEEAARAIGCQADLVAVPVLVLLSAGVGNSRAVELKRGWRESATLFAAVVKPPGEKKTPAAKAALSPVWKRQVDLKREYREKREAYEEELRQWKVNEKIATKNGEAAPPPPPQPVMARTVVEDTTVEALAVLLEDNPRGVLVFRDELTGWVRAMDQYKGGKGADRQNWLSLWSNSPIAVDRKGKPEPVIVESPWVSVLGSIQPSVLPELADNREDGLLDRFLFAYPEPYHAPLSDKEISAAAENGLEELYEGLARLPMPESNGEPFPGRVSLAPGSWEAFKSLSDSLTAEMCALGFPLRLAGAWRKLEAYLARLALILALARAVDSGAREKIEPQDVLNAGRLVEYFKVHARRVHTTLHGESQRDLLAAELKAFLEQRGGEWEGQPDALRNELVGRGSEAVPGQPAELTKMVLEIATHAAGLKAKRAWGKKEGKSHRILRLDLKKPVDRVVPVDLEAGKDNADHGVYGDFEGTLAEYLGSDNGDNAARAGSKSSIARGNPDDGVNLEDDPGVDF
jgi:hypothetical protein